MSREHFSSVARCLAGCASDSNLGIRPTEESVYGVALAVELCLVFGRRITPSPADWGGAKSAYTERCEGEDCAQGQACVGGLCLRPDHAGEDYIPSLRCGDGVQQRWEPCDDGNQNDLDACVSGCRLARLW